MAKWTPEQRAEALELYVELGPSAASERTGIPKGTIGWWASEAGIRTDGAERTAAATEAAALRWAERRANLADRIGAVAELALVQTEAALEDDDRKAKDFALTMAVLIDKAQLLSGDATVRHGLEEDREEVIARARDRALTLVPHAG